MYLTTATASLLLILFATLVTSHPAAATLQKRGLPGAVYICTDRNFRGDCAWNPPSDQCRITGTGTFAPESIGPDPGGFCILFEKADCTGKETNTLRFPGAGDLSTRFASLKCFTENQASAKAPVVAMQRDDPRLAGGVGSATRKELKEQMEHMERDGFKEGMIGLKKGTYY